MSLLYHYTNLDTFAEKILPSLQLLMNKTHLINDPLESNVSFIIDYAYGSNILDVNLKDLLIKERKKYNITCFTTDKTYGRISIPGWGLPKMWTHYGNNHKGICIVLNKEIFLQENEKIVKFQGLVKYQLKFIPPIKILPKLKGNKMNPHIKEVINKNKRVLFFQKHSDWKSEAEFRIVSFGSEFCSISESIVSIIFGLKTPEYNIIGLRQIINNKIIDNEKYLRRNQINLIFPPIKFYKIFIRGSRFDIRSFSNE